MEMKNSKYIGASALLLAILSLSTFTTADESTKKSKHALGTSINTFGIGAFYTYKFNDNFHLRTTFHGLDADIDDIEYSDTDYDGDYESKSAGILLDWYPASRGWQRNIFISGGLMFYDTEFNGSSSARLDDLVSVGNTSFRNPRTSALELNVKHEDEVTPYIGIGWGNKSRGERGFAFVAELGLIYMNPTKVQLRSFVSPDPVSLADLERETRDIIDEEQGIQGFGSVGVSYHF